MNKFFILLILLLPFQLPSYAMMLSPVEKEERKQARSLHMQRLVQNPVLERMDLFPPKIPQDQQKIKGLTPNNIL